MFCWDLPQSRPRNLTMTGYLKLMLHPLHQKTIHKSTGKKPCCHGGCQTCSSTSGWSWSCCCLQPSAPPFWGILPPPKQGHLIYPQPGYCMFCWALILSAYNIPALPDTAFPSPRGRGQLSSEQLLKPCCSTDSPIHKVSAHPSATGLSLYFPAALL